MSELMKVQQKISSLNKEIQWKKKDIKKIEEKITTGTSVSLKKEKERLKEIAKDGMVVEKEFQGSKKQRNDYDVVSNMLRDLSLIHI